MKITWYGTASILISTANHSILFDPYLKYLYKGQEPPEMLERRLNAFKEQTQVFITHGHFDHVSSINKIFNGVNCKIYCTKTPYKRLVKDGIDKRKLVLISPQETITVGDITVKAIQGKHVKFMVKDLVKGTFSKATIIHPIRKLKLSIDFCKYPERGETLMYELLLENKRVQIMGSADLSENIEYQTGADLLILPHQGRSDMDEHNKKIVHKLKPKRVLLDHYDDAFPPFSSTVSTERFCKELSQTIPTQSLIEGNEIEI